MCNKFKAAVDSFLKGLIANNSLVRRHHNNIGIGIDIEYAACTPCHTWGSVTVDRFGKQLYGGKLRQLLAHYVGVSLIGIDKNVFWWKNTGKPVVGLLQLRATASEEINKLLRILLTTARPKTATLTSGKDDTIIVVCFFHVIIGFQIDFYVFIVGHDEVSYFLRKSQDINPILN